MITISKIEVFGWEAAIRGLRNPMNSWDKSDSGWIFDGNKRVENPPYRTEFMTHSDMHFEVGDNDLALMRKLVKAGSDHSKFMRMITVTCDVEAPFYWWKEYDTYKVGTVANSCSTMHKLHERDLTIDDFSHEHLFDGIIQVENPDDPMEFYENSTTCLKYVISVINYHRKKYIETKDKRYWQQMIQLLPTSFNQKRTLHLNYAVLRNIYHARKNHKLTEWHTLCDWIYSLPYSELITDDFKEDTSHEK